MKRLLLLGGLDPSGGAGVTLDATVAALHGVEPLPIALTATVQSARGFSSASPIPRSVWRDQLRAVVGDAVPDAIKVGFIGCSDLVAEVSEELRPLAARAPLVVDPVLSATAGGMAPGAALARAYVDELAPIAALVAPNAPELQALVDGEPAGLLRAGAGAVLQKGGHGDGDEAVDVLWGASAPVRFARPRRSCGAVRGTGCALASAIAAHLARGADLEAACRRAGDWLWELLDAVSPRPDGRPQTLPISRARTSP